MNKTAILALAGVALLATASVLFFHKSSYTKVSTDDYVKTQWTAFKSKYNKKYADPDFEQYRIQVFSENLKFASTNPVNYGVTQFMDLTREEFRSIYLTLKTHWNVKKVPNTPLRGDVEIDWVEKGATTPIKDQGQCGSCWAFSTTGAVEGALFLAKKGLVSLSEQYLVDCSKNGNQGCNGGLMDNGFEFIEKNGIPTEASYPYKAVDQKCKQKSGPYKIKSHTDIKDCDDLLNNLQNQPIAIAVDANNFQFYQGGIFKDCDENLDHGVLLVGYSSKDQYWKVKNSWNTSWGEDGFIRLAPGNTCGLCNAASYPNA